MAWPLFASRWTHFCPCVFCLQARFDWWARTPESLHQVLILFSDRGIPKTYRRMFR